MAKSIIQYGLLVGLATITVQALIGGTGFLGIVFLSFGIYYAQKRKSATIDSPLKFGDFVSIGFKMSSLSGLVIGLYTYVDLSFNPDFIKEVLNQAAYFLEDAGIEGALFDQTMSIYEVILTPFWLGVSVFFGQLILGFFISVFVFLVARKRS
ncbi:MAG: DUF4199 family protein [Bacteroidota bacterium]